ncbi:hypothetical protein Tco_0000199 [Tanacetum coccineum]
MTTLADKSLLSGGDNKPPMLEKHLYDSWKSRMELYMLNRPHGRMILASVEKGPLVWPSITVDGATRLKEYIELTPAEAIQADCDIKAINIILQGLPTEIYALVSQHRVAKDLWEKIKLLMQGTSLTKQEREWQALSKEFQKGDDLRLMLSNHMMSFLTAVVTSRGDKPLMLLEQRENTHLVLSGATCETTDLSSVTPQRGGSILPTVYYASRGKDPGLLTFKRPLRRHHPTMLLYQADDLDAYDSELQEKDSLMKTVSDLKKDLKMEENRNIDREIALEKKIKQLDNIIFKRGQSAQTVHMMTKSKICYDHSTKQAIGFEKPFYLKKVRESKPKLYDGNAILKMDTIVVPDSDETLMLCEESRSKMILKEQDPMVVEP